MWHFYDACSVGRVEDKIKKNLFRKLNEYSKILWAKQEEIAKKYGSLAIQYEELEHLKNNMNEYLGRDKKEKKESIINELKTQKAEDKNKFKENKKNFDVTIDITSNG